MAHHKWRSCDKFGITDTFFSLAGSTYWSTYFKYRCHAHTQGLWSTAILLQHSMSDLLSAVAHTPVGASTVDVTVPQSQRSCSCKQHSAHPHHCSSAHNSSADALRCTRTSLRAYCCTRVLSTNDRRFFITVIPPLCHILELSERRFFVLAFFFRAVRVGDALYLSCCCADFYTAYSIGTAATTLPAAPLLLGT